jgi:septum site-determining protein MinC
MSTAIPSGAFDPAESAPPLDALFATETMAELSARQGRIADAVAIYRHLLAGRSGCPADDERLARWLARLAALERATLAPTPPSPSTPKTANRPPIAKDLVPLVESASPAAGLPEPPRTRHRLPLVVSHPVRSGQIVYAEHSDLIVLAPVNPGAELLADGNIHVYSSLRGRAVAGARGATGAQVFCLDLQAELVGVDSGYVACDDIPPAVWGRAARVWLRDGRCEIEPLTVPPSFAINRARKV